MRIKNILPIVLIAAGCLFTACKSNDNASDGSDNSSVTDNSGVSAADIAGNVGEVAPKSGDLIAEFEINGFGTIRAVLFPDAAPTGVENFRLLADAGFYDGLTIHRVVSDFMFQGGSLNGDGTGGDALVNGGSFGVETADNMRHFYGALCYANAMGTNTTQFYIVNNKLPQELVTTSPTYTLTRSSMNKLQRMRAAIWKRSTTIFRRIITEIWQVGLKTPRTI